MHLCGACMPRRHEPRGIVARKRIAELTAQHAGPTKPAPARSRSRRRGRCWRTPTARCSHRGSRSTDRRQTRHLRQTTLGANDLCSQAVALWLPRVSLVGGSALLRPRALRAAVGLATKPAPQRRQRWPQCQWDGIGRAEPSRAEPSRAEPSRAEPSRAEPGRAGPGRAGPSRAATQRTLQREKGVVVDGAHLLQQQ
jgi:hypothetical protein